MRPRHRRHIQQPFTDRVTGGRKIGDASGVEYGQAHFPFKSANGFQPRRNRRCHPRHIVDGEPQQRVHTPVIAVEEINEPGALKDMRDLDALVLRQPFRHRFVDRASESDKEVIAGLPSNFLEDHQTETAAVLQRPAVAVRPLVGYRRQELADQVRVAERLYAVKPTLLAAPGGLSIGCDHTGDIVVVHFLREAPVERLAYGRRSDRRQPVTSIRLATPAEMGDLAHDGRTMLVHPL